MADAQQEINKLQAQISQGAEETKTYLETLKAKLSAYDDHYKVSETATSFLQTGMDTAHNAVDELKELGDKLQHQGVKDTVVATTQASFDKVHAALESLHQRGRDYDARVKASVSASVASASSTVSDASSTVSNSIETIVSATRDSTTTRLAQLQQQLVAVQQAIAQAGASVSHSALVAAGGVVSKAEALDAHFHVRSTITDAVGVVKDKVVGLDKSLGVSQKALQVDATLSGGKGATLVQRGVEMVNQSVEYVTDALTHAKETAAAAADVKETKETTSATATTIDAVPVKTTTDATTKDKLG